MNSTQSYRPISLLSTMNKIVERVIYTRILEITEEQQALPYDPFGFRNCHSTIQQIIRLTEEIIENFNLSTQTAMVFLDIEKAFDKLWHNGLLYKMHKLQLPTWITRLTQSYLEASQ